MVDFLLDDPFNRLAPIAVSPFVGSFLALVAVRLPVGETIVRGRSRCRTCSRQLGIRDLIPLVSWAASRGRCRSCGARVDPVHPIVEAGAIILAVWSVVALPGSFAWVGCLLGWSLLTLAAIDAREFVLPDAITFPLAAAGLAFTAAVSPDDFFDHVIGTAAGFSVFVALGWLYRRLRGRTGLGLGDAKLMGAAGAWVSWTGLPSVTAIGAVAALAIVAGLSLIGKRQAGGGSEPIAFGPYLALGVWWVWLYGPLALSLEI